MSEFIAAEHQPGPRPGVPTPRQDAPVPPGYDGTTYYGSAQVKPAPFNTLLVGTYVFLAGLSGAAQLLAAVADLGGQRAERTVRRGRYLALLAPTLGTVCLIADLHTPQRFYNMVRIFKRTSPMSIGTYLLLGFSALSGLLAGAQFTLDAVQPAKWRWLRRAARAGQVPAGVLGAGMSTYTAALLAATSTPLWAAAPEAMAVRFGSSSIAAGAAALALGERGCNARRLDEITLAALAVELAAIGAAAKRYEQTGVAPAMRDSAWGIADTLGATGLGVVLPVGLHAVSLLLGRSVPALSKAASIAAIGGSLLMRWSIMGAGNYSARTPEISMRFAQPDNLPRK